MHICLKLLYSGAGAFVWSLHGTQPKIWPYKIWIFCSRMHVESWWSWWHVKASFALKKNSKRSRTVVCKWKAWILELSGQNWICTHESSAGRFSRIPVKFSYLQIEHIHLVFELFYLWRSQNAGKKFSVVIKTFVKQTTKFSSCKVGMFREDDDLIL